MSTRTNTDPGDMRPGLVYTIREQYAGITTTTTGTLTWAREWADGWEVQLDGYLLSLDRHGDWTIETH